MITSLSATIFLSVLSHRGDISYLPVLVLLDLLCRLCVVYLLSVSLLIYYFFFFNDTATTEIYPSCHPRSLHDALPFSRRAGGRPQPRLNHGIFHARRPHHGYPLRRHRPRRPDLPAAREAHGRRGPREAAVPRVGPARPLGHQRRHARPPGERRSGGGPGKIGRAHVRPPVTNPQLVCRLLLEKKKKTTIT